jgi:ATP-binding cassette, subfamily F, member 3
MAVILSVQDLCKEFSGVTLFHPVSFIVREHDRVAILGPNGTGKSTLLKIILGQEEATSGQVILGKSCRVGYLSQDVIEDPNHTLYDEALSVFRNILADEKKLKELSEAISNDPENETLLQDYSAKQIAFEAEGGYDYQYRIETILNIFSFTKDDYTRVISSFSGGEKTRVSFAKLLLLNPDLLILDEPTNHLDIISIEWLEDYLASYSGAVLFVSHDIAFVRKLATQILDIDDHAITVYNTTYDNFARAKKEAYENALEQFRSQEEEKEKLQRFITFYMPKPRFASRAHDREKKLARLEESAISDPTQKHTRKLSIDLKGEIREGKHLIDFTDVSIGYDKPLVSHISFPLFGKDRLAVMGANGTGKTTFGKILLNELKPLSGDIRRYFHLNIGVLRQDIRSYEEEETLFNYFRNLYPRMSNQEIYSALGRYAFTYEEANEKKLSDLSGGELMRIEILHLSLEDYDLLLLDEPTNHLDMMSISELIDALNDYEGTLVIISHDRDFIDKVCNKLLYLYDGQGYYYEGSYEAFKEERLSAIIAAVKERLSQEAASERADRKASSPVVPTHRTRLTRDSPEKILDKIDKAEARKKELTESCSLPENYQDPKKMADIGSAITENDSVLVTLYDELKKAM